MIYLHLRLNMNIKEIFLLLFVSSAANLCYLNSLYGEFVYDDGAAIRKNNDVTEEGPVFATLENIFTNDFWGQSLKNETSHKSYRPLTTFSFRLNWVLTGEDTFPFHLVNTICHVFVSTAVGVLAHVVLGEFAASSTLANLRLRASLW